MLIFLANLPGVTLAGFLAWLGVEVMPDHAVLGWVLIGLVLPVFCFGLYSSQEKGK